MLKKPFLLLLFLCFGARAFSAVFVVTSNADSGPGTLRDALTQAAANGTAEKDYINFNIADTSKAGRTITLESELPFVTANMVIDGSTQPGSILDPAGSKIIITPDRSSYTAEREWTAAFMLQNADNVEIYGFDINDFAGLRNIYEDAFVQNCAIYAANSAHLTIGAPGKGNYMYSDDFIINENSQNATAADSVVNIKIQSNYFDYSSVGPNDQSLFKGSYILDHDILFGGDTPAEGNHVNGAVQLSGKNIWMENNSLALDQYGSPLPDNKFITEIIMGGTNIFFYNNTANIFQLEIDGTNNFAVYNNKDFNTIAGAGSVGRLTLYQCNNGIIGSDDITKENVLYCANSNLGIGNQDSNNIQILKNSIVCSEKAYNAYIESNFPNIHLPAIKVLVNSDTEFSGKASPNSKIYVYEDNTDCDICNPVAYITTLTAAADSTWKLTGSFAGKKMLANALLNQNSSEYTAPEIPVDYRNSIIRQPSCGLKNGVITISYPLKTLKVKWYDSNTNQEVGEGDTIKNLGPGNYYAKAYNGNCASAPMGFQLYDVEPQIISTYVSILNPSCGKGGSITGLIPTTDSQDLATYKWTDSNNNVVGNQAEISNLSAGTYTLTMTDTVTKCSTTYGPITLKNTTGPNIDQSHVKVQSTNCGQSTGSITNIPATGTGTLTYSWINSAQQTVSTDSILTNQPAGTYKLQITDNTQCGPLYSSDITIPETNGITMDESKAVTSPASCGKDNGSVTGIIITGATQYQWLDANNNTVGTNADLQNVPSGNYTLTASNGFGCSKTSKTYFIAQPPGTIYPTYTVSMSESCYGLNNGSLTITTDALAKSLRWVNSQNQPVGNTQQINGLAPDVYTLYLTDANGCEIAYGSYSVLGAAQTQIVPESEQITPDQCSTKTGSISNIQITGGIPPYTYSWTDQNNVVFSSSASVSGLAAGTYQLNVNDSKECGLVAASYTVPNQDNTISPPLVNDVGLCTPGNALVQVQNVVAGYNYRLYDSGTSTTPIDEQTNGVFKITVNTNTTYFVSQFTGTCESSRTKVNVTVGLSGVNIANAITPNGDGINDYWQITGIDNYPAALVQIFNRYGQKLFESKGYSIPFDGTYKGQKLPSGVYYYIINLNTKCNLLSGSLTILR